MALPVTLGGGGSHDPLPPLEIRDLMNLLVKYILRVEAIERKLGIKVGD